MVCGRTLLPMALFGLVEAGASAKDEPGSTGVPCTKGPSLNAALTNAGLLRGGQYSTMDGEHLVPGDEAGLWQRDVRPLRKLDRGCPTRASSFGSDRHDRRSGVTMAGHLVLFTLLFLTATSSVAAQPYEITFPGLRPRADPVRGRGQFEANEAFAPARHRRIAVSCSGLAAATDPSVVIVGYQGGVQDGMETIHQVDIPDRDIVTIELDYADPAADLDLILFEGHRIVAASNVDAAGHSEKIVTTVNGGRYFIGVSAVKGSSAYTLSADFSDSTTLSCEPVTELEPQPGKHLLERERAIGATGARRRSVARPVKPPSCTFGVSPMTQSLAQAAGTLTINVTAQPGCDWRASSNATWMRVLWGGSAYGNGSAGFSVGANTGTFPRTGTLTVAGKTVSITQSGPCTYSVSPTNPQIAASGGANTVSVTAGVGCAWSVSVSTTATWITITSGQSGTGDGTVAYSVAPNSSTSARTGTLTVAGKTVTVKQAPDTSSCTYAVSYGSKTLSWCGGERSVAVTTQGECPWTASKDASWITLGGAIRTGTGPLFYVLERNAGGSRQGTITVAGTPVAITQNPRSGGGTHDGIWKGTTNSNRNVELCVADGAVQDALVFVRLTFTTFSCTGPLTIANPVPITGSTFSGPFTFPGSNISTTVRGSFTSSTAMNGSHEGYSGGFFIICGSTVSIGTAGTILSPGTYTATKQP